MYHDLVARPRVRHLHSYEGCGWHYSQFSVTAGRDVYRWKVNELLKAVGIGYALAGTGEDVGRLVAVYDDGRSGSLSTTSSPNARPESASPCRACRRALPEPYWQTPSTSAPTPLALAGVLEERRQLIKAELGTPD